MIKHEEVRKIILFVPKDEILLQTYITEQEKKDELLELYKDFYNNDGKTTIENYYKIKALEEELK